MSLSAIVSVYNESASLPLFYPAVKQEVEHFATEYKVIFVNNGNTDCADQTISSPIEPNSAVKLLLLAKNIWQKYPNKLSEKWVRLLTYLWLGLPLWHLWHTYAHFRTQLSLSIPIMALSKHPLL